MADTIPTLRGRTGTRLADARFGVVGSGLGRGVYPADLLQREKRTDPLKHLVVSVVPGAATVPPPVCVGSDSGYE